MMTVIALLLLLQNAVSGENYYLEISHLLYPGVPNFSRFAMMNVFQGFLASYYDENGMHINHHWMKDLIKENAKEWQSYVKDCLEYKDLLRDETKDFNTQPNQSEGNEVIQQIIGCDWDEETNYTHGHVKYGNNGEDFIILDTKTETWIATNPQAEVIAKAWNADKAYYEMAKSVFQNECLPLLKVFLRYGKSYLSRKVLPSVFLLQKSPSSPVTCHSTGFFPDKAMMFWRKDGEEIHEGVEHGDLLSNDDESFQMSVDLEVQSIPPEDWGRYECVFELSGVQNYVITKLDQNSIRSNNPKNRLSGGLLSITSIAISATKGCVIVIIIVVLSVTAFKKRKASETASETASL